MTAFQRSNWVIFQQLKCHKVEVGAVWLSSQLNQPPSLHHGIREDNSEQGKHYCLANGGLKSQSDFALTWLYGSMEGISEGENYS